MAVARAVHRPDPPSGDASRAADELAGAAPATIQFRQRSLGAGYTAFPNAVLRSPRLNPTAKVVYGLLLSYAWQQGRTWPGQDVLASDLGVTARTIRTALADLKAVGLISIEQRGLRQTNVYWIEPLEAFAQAEAPPEEPAGAPSPAVAQDPGGFRSERKNFSGLDRKLVAALDRKPASDKEDSPEEDAKEQHHRPPAGPQPPLAPTSPETHEDTGAVDDALFELLISHGISQRIAQGLATTCDARVIKQQIRWHPYRPGVKNPAGALVEAIKQNWPAPPAWLDAQEHAAAVVRQAEEEARRQAQDEARRREWAAKPPEERVHGRLQFWIQKQRLKGGREPTEAEIAARRAELLAELVGAPTADDQAAAQPGAVS